MRAEFLRRFADQRRVSDRRGIDGDLVRTRREHGAEVLRRTDAAAHRERYEYLLARAADDIVRRGAVFATGGDIQKDDLVRTDPIVRFRRFHGIARVDEIDEIDALHHAPLVDIEAGYDAFTQHRNSYIFVHEISSKETNKFPVSFERQPPFMRYSRISAAFFSL